MQKSQLYCKGKVKLLHKLAGMEILNKDYGYVHTQHDRYKGYHSFPKKSAVEDRFQSGKPLSSFCLVSSSCNEVHVAFTTDKPEQKGDKVKFLTFCYHTSQMDTHEIGMQFCQFVWTDEVVSVKKASMNIVDYALLFPYSKRGVPFQRHLTLV